MEICLALITVSFAQDAQGGSLKLNGHRVIVKSNYVFDDDGDDDHETVVHHSIGSRVTVIVSYVRPTFKNQPRRRFD